METRKGEILVSSDGDRYEITLLEPEGTKIKGSFSGCMFRVSMLGDHEFTVENIVPGGKCYSDISSEWVDRSAGMQERTRVGRWF